MYRAVAAEPPARRGPVAGLGDRPFPMPAQADHPNGPTGRDGHTNLEYGGEMGADLWAAGRWWTERVARVWEATVRSSFTAIKTEAERRHHANR